MAQFELIMPKMGESIMEATILKWLKKEGDPIGPDESVLEIATDKVDSEVPSPVEGTLSKILYKEGETIQVGKAIAIINTNGDSKGSSTEVKAAPETAPDQPVSSQTAKLETASSSHTTATKSTDVHSSTQRFYSPLVLNIARSEGISMSELESLPGTGKDDRVTKKDILDYVSQKGNKPTESAGAGSQSSNQASPITAGSLSTATSKSSGSASADGNVEIVEMDRMRKLIADHMVMSKQTSPHVTSFVEADVTNMVLWRNKIKDKFEKREGEKITFTPLFVEIIARALKEFPLVNASVDGTKMLIKKDINIGMATALPSGNLIVPVIKNADRKNLIGLTKEVNSLASRARINQLKPEDIQGGTFTFTNVGTFGNLMGTPIINQPQVAILATGAIKKKPVVLETPEGDVIAIRHMMFLSLSYDHRIVDGALGGSFLRKVADYFEEFNINREF